MSLGIATAGTANRSEADNRQILKDFLDLLKKGQSFLESEDVPRSEQPVSSQAPAPPPETMKQAIEANTKASMSSPAAAAGMASVGHVQTQEEMAAQVKAGQASRCAVVTAPAGAEINIDGNKAGLSPMVFVLLRKADTPRVITIKLSGYKTVEKRVVPDGNIIPLGLTLEKEEVPSSPPHPPAADLAVASAQHNGIESALLATFRRKIQFPHEAEGGTKGKTRRGERRA